MMICIRFEKETWVWFCRDADKCFTSIEVFVRWMKNNWKIDCVNFVETELCIECMFLC